ncbi:NADPH:quinone reductase [Humibacillus sp. DSM 29435]|uniref:NADP-dependent oxidoreductase n=1 Tax=Humibacillus sp. DSM 29435 TaxID=1869167 RepID=UPI00087205FA|nr:NADP-dependent oxidoreductase [Humibacillus sp. DSM 29435]OFE17097.1 NADPH:quinone reductase [Humibacillus sp. DSM 29435]
MSAAVIYSHYGSPEVLVLSEVVPPEPGPGQVLVRVRAATVNPLDIKLRRGDMSLVRPQRFPVTPGLDAAGIVAAVGADVQGLEVGDEVFGATITGSYADFALMEAPTPKPAGLEWGLAASLATVGEAAYRALAHLGLEAGQTLLVHGAAGSVGAIATQLAVARDIIVIGSVGPDDLKEVESFGATAVEYGPGLVNRVRFAAPQGVDAALDTAGHGVLPDSIELTGSADTVITIADPAAGQFGVRFTGDDHSDRAFAALPELAELAVEGKLTVRVWGRYPLTDAARAHAEIEAGTAHGKIILLP